MDFKAIQQRKARLRGACAAALAGASLLLASCGGGQQLVAFQPARVLAFGDETSVIVDALGDANGRKYTVNAVKTDLTTLDCAVNPNWVQYLAVSFGLVFPQCNPGAIVSPASRILAKPGAKVADVIAQINQQFATDAFRNTDLVTILVGANDILAQYRTYPGVSEAQMVAVVEQAGTDTAGQVNRIAAAGGKVLISTVPDLGLTPYALAQRAANTDTDRAALLTRLTARFNAKVRLNINNDGRSIGLLLSDELFQTLVKFPATYSFTNVTDAACAVTAVLPACTTQTFAGPDSAGNAASDTAWLWADSTQPSPAGHARLGQLAEARARGNPF